MQFETIDTISGIAALAEEWRALLDKSASSGPFLTPEYLSAWWRHLGGGEWQHAELQLIIARDEDGGLVGIAPLFLTQNKDDQATLMFIGSHEISDFLDFIARPEDMPQFLSELFDFLASPQAPQWQRLDMYNILDDSSTPNILANLATQHGWKHQQTQLQPAPYIPLPGNWDEYLASMKKKQRHELRRKMRKAENHLIPVEWYIVEDRAALSDEMQTMFALMKQDEEKKIFLTPVMELQMMAIAEAAFENGWLQLAVLKVGRDIAAMELNFDYDNRIWSYNSGVHSNFRDLSSGVVLLGNVLRHVIEDDHTAFDFMRGDEQYKYRMGAVDRFVLRVEIKKG